MSNSVDSKLSLSAQYFRVSTINVLEKNYVKSFFGEESAYTQESQRTKSWTGPVPGSRQETFFAFQEGREN